MSEGLADLLRDRGGFGETYTHIPLESDSDTDGDGRAELVFGDAREIEATFRAEAPVTSSDFIGRRESARLAAYIPNDQGVTKDDAIVTSISPNEVEGLRVTEPQPANAANADFTVWLLKEDDRIEDVADYGVDL